MTTECVKPLVVVVGEDPEVFRSIQYVAASYGICVDAFTSAHDFVIAIEAIPSFVPACVILNTHLSKVNGFDVLERIRASRPSIPVICLAEPSDASHPRVSSVWEPSASLQKPLGLDTFAALLLNILRPVPGFDVAASGQAAFSSRTQAPVGLLAKKPRSIRGQPRLAK